MSILENLYKTIESSRNDIIQLQTLLTSIPAVAPESGGDGESKKCSALKKWLIEKGFGENQFTQIDIAPCKNKSQQA